MVACDIMVGEVLSVITGMYDLDALRKVTSYYVEGFQFTKKFKDRHWDGRKHLFNKRLRAFPTGLLTDVLEALKKATPGIQINLKWCGSKPHTPVGGEFTLHGIEFGVGKYDYQLEAAKAMVAKKRGILKIATNGGKTEVACAVSKYIGGTTLFLVERTLLLYQTRERFAKRLNLPIEEIGIIGDGHCVVKDITIASPTSFVNRVSEGVVPKEWTVLFLDECHGVASDVYYEAAMFATAQYRFGLSGTPLDRRDGADLRLLAMTGPIIYEVRNKLLIERGISVAPAVKMITIDQPPIPDGMTYAQVEKLGVRENEQLNTAVVENAAQQAKKKKQVLVLVDKTSHGKHLLERFKLKKVKNCVFIHGKEDIQVRLSALKDYESGKTRILISTPILDQGVDISNIDVLVLAAGGESVIKLLQRVGRGLRSGKDKEGLLVIDFANKTHRYLLDHSLTRLRTYKEEDCFMISGE